MAARRKVHLEVASDAAVRVETETEIESESESSSEAAVDTESSTEEEDSIVSMADIGHGDEDAAGERQDDFDSLFGESVVPECADHGDEDVEVETEEEDIVNLQENANVVYAEGERDAELVSPVRESVVPERVDDEEEVAEGESNEGFVSPGRDSVVRDSIVPERVDDGDERARNEPTSVDSDVLLFEGRARSDAKGKGKAVGKDGEYVGLVRDSVVPERVEDDNDDAEGDKDDEFVSPVHHSVVLEPVDHHDEDGHVSPLRDSAILERLDHHDEDANSLPASLDSELPLLERRARREAKREAKGKGKTVYDDEHVSAIRDSIVPERIDHHDEKEDATSETASLNSEVPLLDRNAGREAKGKQKAVRKGETSDLKSMEAPSEDISSTQVKNTRTLTRKASGKKWSKYRLSDTPKTDDDDWVGVSNEYSVDDDVVGPSRAEGGGRRKGERRRKVFKEPSTEDEMHELPRISRIMFVASPARTTIRNPANMSSKKPHTAPATASKKKGDRSSGQKTVVISEVAAAEAIWRDEAKKQTSETMREMIADRWASGDMREVLEKIMATNAAKKAASSSPSKPMPGVIAPEPESIQQEADTAEVFETKARARRGRR